MAQKVFSRVLQFLAAIAVFSSVWLINSTQARVIGSPLARQTASDAGKQISVHSPGSFKFLSDPEWRAKLQFGNKVASDGEKSLPEETEQLKNLTADEQPTKQSEDEISGSGTVNSNSPHQSGNPFLRSKRDTSGSCSFPTNLPEKVKELNEFLHDSQYVGVIPEQDDYIPIPHDQPTNCPAAVGDWWPRPEINLRSTCPSIKEELDNGPDAYPRHLVQDKCLCTDRCVDSNVNYCREIRQDVTIFRMQGCKDGVALMSKDIVTITVGCFCAAPRPNTPSSGSSGGPPLTD